MLTFFLFCFVCVSCLVAFSNWRSGLFPCILVAIIQDPIRKVTPESPAYLTLAFVPVMFAMMVNLWLTSDPLANFRRYYPQLTWPGIILLFAVLGSTAQTLSYGLNAMPIALLGLFSYAGVIPAILLGFFFVRRDFKELDWPLVIFAALISLMLIGVPLEYTGVKFSEPWLGTIAMKENWRRWYSNTDWVIMISGFYRSPEIMGYHASFLCIICTYLMARRPKLWPLWAVLASWGLFCTLLSGRRKVFFMILIFVILFFLLNEGLQRRKLFVVLLASLCIVVPFLLYSVDDSYIQTAQSGLTTGGARTEHTLIGPLWLLGIVGPFGYGVGTKTQGTQHLGIIINTPLLEGGFEKVMVELGIVGSVAFVVFAVAMIRSLLLSNRRVAAARMSRIGMAGLTAFLVANAGGFMIAFQLYGDPFVVFLVGLATGLALSGSRLAHNSMVVQKVYQQRRTEATLEIVAR